MDEILDWVEAQVEEIGDPSRDQGQQPMVRFATSLTEVSKQLWASLGPTLSKDSAMSTVFGNVPRHNGLEAWRRVAEPINDDKTMIRKDLLPLITKPRSASSLDGISAAFEDWDTNIRLFKAAHGSEPTDETKRLTLLQMLQQDVSAYAVMHMELPELSTFSGMKRVTMKYVKVIQNLRRKGRAPAHIVEEQRHKCPKLGRRRRRPRWKR